MNKLSTWIIVALGAIIVVLLLFWPKSVDPGKDQYEDTIKILRSEKAVIQSRQEATVKTYNAKLKEDSLSLALQDARIKALKSKLANQRPTVIEKIQADTAVLSYVSTLEEVVTEQQVQIDTLKAQKEFQRKLNEDLIAQEFVEDKIEQQMSLDYTRRIAELENQSRKKERKSRLSKILIPIVGIAGFLVGAAL